jgi:hypothetical protein
VLEGVLAGADGRCDRRSRSGAVTPSEIVRPSKAGVLTKLLPRGRPAGRNDHESEWAAGRLQVEAPSGGEDAGIGSGSMSSRWEVDRTAYGGGKLYSSDDPDPSESLLTRIPVSSMTCDRCP